ncbi:MAG TPA: hypothetical protein VIQ60_11225 [Gemmatimonadaceae bacterium]|jgi:hypothetical protein
MHAQESAYRFTIARSTDSTFTFSTARNDWVRSGMSGIAVDPAQRDALIARFRVTHVDDDSAVALITGQTTRVTSEHVALLERPRKPWYRQATFWLGGVLGALVAVVASR